MGEGEEERVNEVDEREEDDIGDSNLTSSGDCSPNVPSRISRRIQAKISCYFERQKQLMTSIASDSTDTLPAKTTTTTSKVMLARRGVSPGLSTAKKPKAGQNFLKQQNVRRQLREQQKQRIALRRQQIETV